MKERRSVSFEWKGIAPSDRLRACAETQARFLERCGRMRRLFIESRATGSEAQYRVSCKCDDRSRSITVVRSGLAMSIESFRTAQGSYCRAPVREAPRRDPC